MENKELKKAKKEVNLWTVLTVISTGICVYGIVNKGFEFYYLLPIVLTSSYLFQNWKKLQKLKDGK